MKLSVEKFEPLKIEIQLRFFASLKEVLGEGESLLLVAPTTVGGVRDLLIARGEPYATRLQRGGAVRAAQDQTICSDSRQVTASCEIAFFPPVTGG